MRWLEVATTPEAIARAIEENGIQHGIQPTGPPRFIVAPSEQFQLPFGA